MDRFLERGSQSELYPSKRRRLEESYELSEREFRTIWTEFCKLTEPIIILTLLFLPEDYLWMFWQQFPKEDVYHKAYFSRYHITSFCHVFKSGKIGVFNRLVSLDLAVEPSWYEFLFDNFNTFFPVLRRLSFLWFCNPPSASELLVLLDHPLIEIFRLKTYSKLDFTDFQLVFSSFLQRNSIRMPIDYQKLKLVELSYGTQKIAFCLSSGLLSIRPRKSDSEIYIEHFDIFNNMPGILDCRLLPRIRQCTTLVLAAKEFSHVDELSAITREKFPNLRELNIYTASNTVEALVQEGARIAGYKYRIASLQEFNDVLYM